MCIRDRPVIGLREGAWLEVNDDHMLLGGTTGGVLFEQGAAPKELATGDDLSELLSQ